MAWTGSPVKKTSTTSFAMQNENTAKHRGLQHFPSSPFPSLIGPKMTNRDNAIQLQKSIGKMEDPMSELLAKLHEQQEMLARQKRALNGSDHNSSSSGPTNPYDTTPPAEVTTSDGRPDAAEVLRLRKQLDAANEKVALANLQLTQAGLASHTMEEAIGSPFPGAHHLAVNLSGQYNVPVTGTVSSNGSFGRAPSPFGHNTFNLQSQNTNTNTTTTYSRPQSAFAGHSSFPPPVTPQHAQGQFAFAGNIMQGQQQPPIGTRLSPTATEFGIGRGGWNMQQQLQQQPPSYVNTLEPINYRRLLDRDMSCNWKYIVDKIVCNNDQQASIFLQQKLKVGTVDQKFEIVQSIIDQAYSLMVNRFGNFLVQRCFEHGTPDQIVAIAQAIRGNTLNLSMDAFGCHVVQKAFDCVPEEYKAIMVHELLRRIPETVIHRYACHVWQKLFELRWSDSPPQIMKYVNEALRGMWHEVALGETGSLVVQNIFENCLEEDKRPCINEVLASIDVVAHGQFGNWCIQHICEHGSIPDRTRATEHVLRFATEYSMDQFASKVVEKCLKIGGTDFLDQYLDRVCEARSDRPRMPLIDIAGDQFGNYLIQYVLTNSDAQRREIVAAHIRKHMVSLRGSKYGSRVAMLCSNPAVATRPGPPTGAPFGRPGNFNDRFAPDFSRGYVGRGFNQQGNFGGGYR